MARKIELVVNTCKECPYCRFESAIGTHFCLYDRANHELEYIDLENMDIAAGIHPDCPLPRTVGIVAPTTPVLKEPMPFKCTALQVQELNECPEEWMERIRAEEKAYVERPRRETEADVEKLFEGFTESDE